MRNKIRRQGYTGQTLCFNSQPFEKTKKHITSEFGIHQDPLATNQPTNLSWFLLRELRIKKSTLALI